MIKIYNLKNKKPKHEYDFYIDRRSPVGNPYPMNRKSQRDEVCDAYKIHFDNLLKFASPEFATYLSLMRRTYFIHGKINLFCWCSPERCHGETIREWLQNNKTQQIKPKKKEKTIESNNVYTCMFCGNETTEELKCGIPKECPCQTINRKEESQK